MLLGALNKRFFTFLPRYFSLEITILEELYRIFSKSSATHIHRLCVVLQLKSICQWSWAAVPDTIHGQVWCCFYKSIYSYASYLMLININMIFLYNMLNIDNKRIVSMIHIWIELGNLFRRRRCRLIFAFCYFCRTLPILLHSCAVHAL